MPTLHHVAQVGDIADGESTVVVVNFKPIALFHRNGQYFAIDDCCPHMGASLAGGFFEEEGVVSCPLHYWRFRITDGTWADNPRIKIGAYPVHVQGDDIVLEIPDPPPPKTIPAGDST